MDSARKRLEKFLATRFEASQISIEQLTPDASLREYFRVNWSPEKTAIACVYGESFKAAEHSYLDVTNLFLVGSLPVAKIYDFDERLAVIAQEDFGDTILRDVLLQSDDEKRERLLNEAIKLIAGIQAATPKAFELNSIASRLKFDEEKLLWELNFFKEHYFESFKKQPLSVADDKALTAEFIEISRELESHAEVLCHRDFHAANLMLDKENRLRIIDHQDARIGSIAYDLVSLLLDRVSEPPSVDWVRRKRAFFLNEREKIGLEIINPAEFAREFDLQAIQRCLKATGTFSYQSTFRAKTYFIPFIKPMLQIVFNSAQRLDRFPSLQRILGNRLKP
ncbi:MAG: aminoglycoside phosphotransferase family protein [Pyrinomonadaceae bacterium]